MGRYFFNLTKDSMLKWLRVGFLLMISSLIEKLGNNRRKKFFRILRMIWELGLILEIEFLWVERC